MNSTINCAVNKLKARTNKPLSTYTKLISRTFTSILSLHSERQDKAIIPNFPSIGKEFPEFTSFLTTGTEIVARDRIHHVRFKMRCAILTLSIINNPISNRLRGTAKVTGLNEDINWTTKFPENICKYDDCQSLHEVMPLINGMLTFLNDNGYKLDSTTNVTGYHTGESFVIWNLSIP